MTKLMRTAKLMGKAMGKAMGEAMGEARGEARGFINSINTFLTARFKDIPGKVFERVEAHSNIETLKQLSLKVATAESLEVFTEFLFSLPVPPDPRR